MNKLKNRWSFGVAGVGTLHLLAVVGLVWRTVLNGWGWFFIAFFSINIVTLLVAVVLSWFNAFKPSKAKAGIALIMTLISTLSIIFVPREGLIMLILLGLALMAVLRNPKS